MTRAESSVQQTDHAGAGRYDPGMLDASKDKLARSRAAAGRSDGRVAGQLAEQADLYAKLAAAIAGSENAQKPSADLRASIETLRAALAGQAAQATATTGEFMTTFRTAAAIPRTAIIAAGCASTPTIILEIKTARAEPRQADGDPLSQGAAGIRLDEAEAASAAVENVATQRKPLPLITHPFFLATQRPRIAQAQLSEPRARQEVAQGEAEREEVLLEARTVEAAAADASAASASRGAAIRTGSAPTTTTVTCRSIARMWSRRHWRHAVAPPRASAVVERMRGIRMRRLTVRAVGSRTVVSQ